MDKAIKPHINLATEIILRNQEFFHFHVSSKKMLGLYRYCFFFPTQQY